MVEIVKYRYYTEKIFEKSTNDFLEIKYGGECFGEIILSGDKDLLEKKFAIAQKLKNEGIKQKLIVLESEFE